MNLDLDFLSKLQEWAQGAIMLLVMVLMAVGLFVAFFPWELVLLAVLVFS